MSSLNPTKKNRYEIIHLGLHGHEWIAVIWDRRDKRVAGSAVGKDLDEVVKSCVETISSL